MFGPVAVADYNSLIDHLHPPPLDRGSDAGQNCAPNLATPQRAGARYFSGESISGAPGFGGPSTELLRNGRISLANRDPFHASCTDFSRPRKLAGQQMQKATYPTNASLQIPSEKCWFPRWRGFPLVRHNPPGAPLRPTSLIGGERSVYGNACAGRTPAWECRAQQRPPSPGRGHGPNSPCEGAPTAGVKHKGGKACRDPPATRPLSSDFPRIGSRAVRRTVDSG